MQTAQIAKASISNMDRQQILEKVRAKIKEDMEKDMKKEVFYDEEDTRIYDDEGDMSQEGLLEKGEDGQPQAKKSKQGGCLQRLLRQNKVSQDFNQLTKDEKRSRHTLEKEEFMEKLRLFKFYKASNFYEDNIGWVEVQNQEGQIILTSFPIPNFTQHLPFESREMVPYLVNKVSQ